MTENKTAIVTGASSGIGLAIARRFLARGYNVVGNARTIERLQDAHEQLGKPANFVLVAGDIADPETATALFDIAIAAFGKVDILINNAGIFIAKPISEYTYDDLDTIVATNLKGFFYPTQRAAEHMAARRDGHIVTISASIAMQPTARVPALLPILIKGGLNQATRGLAIELAASNVRVNAVAPGIIETPMHDDDEDSKRFFRTLAPNGAIGATDDIVDAVLYLTDSTFTTGTVMPVDGGASAGTW